MVFRLKELRKERGVSQVKLSELSGICRPVIIKMELNDDASVTTDTVIALARALQVEPGDLFCTLCHQ